MTSVLNAKGCQFLHHIRLFEQKINLLDDLVELFFRFIATRFTDETFRTILQFLLDLLEVVIIYRAFKELIPDTNSTAIPEK